MFLLSATEANSSDAILLPFQGRWKRRILDGKVELVFRKRAPADFSPQCMYIYIGKPVSSLIGRVTIKSLNWVPFADLENLADRGKLTQEELMDYVDLADGLWAYEIGTVEAAPTPLPLSSLAAKYKYIPTPNYVRLSKDGPRQFDEDLGLKTANRHSV